MRYPILVEKRMFGISSDLMQTETQYVVKFQIQRWKDNEERFLFVLDVVGAPTYSEGIPSEHARFIRGLETIGRFAPLDRCPVATGRPVNAVERMLAVAAAYPHNTLERERAAKALRVSTGVMKRIDKDLQEHSGRAIAEAWCNSLAPFWQKQAAMAEGYLRGTVTDLAFYPVSARMKPQA